MIMKASAKQKLTQTKPMVRGNIHSAQPNYKQKKNGRQEYGTSPNLERSPVFTEIWPNSEPSSPCESPTSHKHVPKTSILESSEVHMEESSALSKYLDRFRHGEPQSREERQKESKEQLPSWWASAPSLPPGATADNAEQRRLHHNKIISPSRGSLSILSDNSQCEPYESEILQLQERASRLLHRGEFPLEDDSLPVSSEGIGSSEFSSPVSADEPVRKPIISSLPKYNTATPLRPEEDILFQWRLRRKMEKAREWTQAQQHFDPYSWRGRNENPLQHKTTEPQSMYSPDFPQGEPQTSTGGRHLNSLDQQTSPPAMLPSGSAAASLHAPAHVPSHTHLLCDILPCPNRLLSTCEEATVPQRPHTQTLPQNTPISGRAEKDVALSNAKITKEATTQVENREKKCSRSSQELNKSSARIHRRQKVPTKTSTPQKLHKRTDLNVRSREEEAPASPIHRALGQAVSEILFQSVDSTASDVVPSEHTDSAEVVSQFLQEAQDSDESEFEDDPLLQVLRKQRKWVKEQITEVDALLKEVQQQHNI
ncbi:unnamed protein product [Knipowitschia caucasica]